MWARRVFPGVCLAVALALSARFIAALLGSSLMDGGKTPLSPVLCAVVLGMVWRNLIGFSPRYEAGLQWTMQSLLKVGIALVGLRLTLTGVTTVASVALPVVMACIATALVVGWFVARRLGLSGRLGVLLAVGTAVCGCTAVVSLSPVIRARESETALAIASVILFGCLGMLVYPQIASMLFESSPMQAGVFLGTSIHDTSQVIGAALIYSQQNAAPEVLGAAGLTKLIRNLSMVVLIPAAAWIAHGGQAAVTGERASVLPPFVMFFAAFVLLRTLGDVFFSAPLASASLFAAFIGAASTASEIFLTCGMTAVGMSIAFAELRKTGWAPLIGGALIAVAVLACSVFMSARSVS